MDTQPIDILNQYCPSRRVLELLGDKWTLLTLNAIARGINRHNALQREIGGISQKMLSQTLRDLERNGILTRHVYPVVPPRVEYELTALGKSLNEPVVALGKWAQDNFAQVESSRAKYDQLNSTHDGNE
jgi:DNA-binding HxlR family transcriptional regulator